MPQKTAHRIKVLIVDDSPTARNLLTYILQSDPDIEVIGAARDGSEAIEFLKHKRPDLITMDIYMPNMDGLEATRRIMEDNPIPIVIVSTYWNPDEVDKTFRATEAGAVAIVEKPTGIGHSRYREKSNELLKTVKLMSEIKVVRRRHRTGRRVVLSEVAETTEGRKRSIKVVAIGVSTGGPPVLKTILSRLPEKFGAPILIVQHISEGFLHGLAEWLAKNTTLPIHIARDGEHILPAHTYLAPPGIQMGVVRGSKILLKDDTPLNGVCPSASYLFRSIADVYGANAAGILLTGMGKDGARELKLMRDKGAITIAQDSYSSVVHGMAGEAIKLGCVNFVLPPEKIAEKLTTMVDREI